MPLSRKSVWLGASITPLAALVIVALAMPRSFALTAFSDVVQCFLLLSGTLAFIPLALRSRGRVRLFWWLITLGVAFWLLYQLYWTYYEMILRRDVPDLCAWDVVLFLHIVPFMAALALRPHVPRDEYAARIGQLDFALLLVWWLYLYVVIVLPWQYVVPDISAYNGNLNALYSAEKLALLAGLIVCWIISKAQWKKLYAALFAMSLCYSASSTIANWAIARNAYYSGSLYDIPLVAAMASLTWIGLCTTAEKPGPVASGSTVYGVWVARFSMIAAFSLPLFGAWSMSSLIPSRIRVFRLGLTLLAALFMGIMVLVRQRILDRELSRLLQHSRDSFDGLKRLQAQILQSEKSASITQLVGGAAHELNNPITAMLGYSDLLLSTSLTPEQQPLAAKIGLYVRRTKSQVASLISFARQSPSPKSPLDLNTLARTALKLTQAQWESAEIEIRADFDNNLPRVLGDSNQLLHVCLQLVTSCLHAESERGGRSLSIRSAQLGENCILEVTTEANGSTENGESHAWCGTYEESLGLSACRGILHEHHGVVSCEQRNDGAVVLRVELPAMPAAVPQPKAATVPVLWRSQPSS